MGSSVLSRCLSFLCLSLFLSWFPRMLIIIRILWQKFRTVFFYFILWIIKTTTINWSLLAWCRSSWARCGIPNGAQTLERFFIVTTKYFDRWAFFTYWNFVNLETFPAPNLCLCSRAFLSRQQEWAMNFFADDAMLFECFPTTKCGSKLDIYFEF